MFFYRTRWKEPTTNKIIVNNQEKHSMVQQVVDEIILHEK